ncbi:putative AAT_I superfamily protein [Citrobacter phage CVT22]|uniref:AAT_I superfamily protein n=1 Tax=Citrobacter phage CVT22 TaxID=1622234 RepID=A0A0R5ZWN4_9CAUD|nr:putative AAT_I superfamily protein [Citrobacter phage CVT22]AJT60735.1 putative AAT_I superfamily protein [Citrobacter phage CVT22]
MDAWSKAIYGVKHDQDKPHMNLLFQEVPNALVEVAKALRMGEIKYGRENWKKVDNLEDRYLAALLRHLIAIHQGEEKDQESGLNHLAHVAVNALFLLDYKAGK